MKEEKEIKKCKHLRNHRKMVKLERDKLYQEVIEALQKSQDIMYPIETIKWATTRFINSLRKNPNN